MKTAAQRFCDKYDIVLKLSDALDNDEAKQTRPVAEDV